MILSTLMCSVSFAETVKIGATPAEGPMVLSTQAETQAASGNTTTYSSTKARTEGGTAFPYDLRLSVNEVDKLCYAGHITSGGIYYTDGFLITADTKFSLENERIADSDEIWSVVGELTLIFENSNNTGCTTEVIKKFNAGDIKPGTQYSLLSESTIKSLTQRKKLYSNDLCSLRLTLNYGKQKKTYLFFITDVNEYNEKLAKQAVQ
ncbi:MAG: hypothetical protein Q4B67_09755 [Eubacteriales bacterium]|nr:hypothetical protein [Eubacteriales bacterium]